MSEKHTPGPWVVHRDFPNYIVPQDHAKRPCGASVFDEQDLRTYAQSVASVQFSRRHRTEAEIAANARLIAAAPDGLALAELIVALTGNVDHSQGGGENTARLYGGMLNDIRDAAQAFIAKARGEQP